MTAVNTRAARIILTAGGGSERSIIRAYNSPMRHTNLVVFQSYGSRAEAGLAKGALEDAGIQTMIRADTAGGMREHHTLRGPARDFKSWCARKRHLWRVMCSRHRFESVENSESDFKTTTTLDHRGATLPRKSSLPRRSCQYSAIKPSVPTWCELLACFFSCGFEFVSGLPLDQS
jgi:hypothetical protein